MTGFYEYGTYYEPYNIVEQSTKDEWTLIRLHIAARVSYKSRTPVIFFHDYHLELEAPYKQ